MTPWLVAKIEVYRDSAARTYEVRVCVLGKIYTLPVYSTIGGLLDTVSKHIAIAVREKEGKQP